MQVLNSLGLKFESRRSNNSVANRVPLSIPQIRLRGENGRSYRCKHSSSSRYRERRQRRAHLVLLISTHSCC